MENDVLKNKIAPWQEKGRWYKFTIVSDGSVFSVDQSKSDLAATVVAGTNLDIDFTSLIDVKYNIIKFSAGGGANLSIPGNSWRITSDNIHFRLHLILAPSQVLEYEVYVFGLV